MTHNRVTKIRNVVCIVFSVLLAGTLAYMIHTNNQEQKIREEAIEELQTEARPYEIELRKLEDELEDLENITYSSEKAEIMIGFIISDLADISYIENKSEVYGFEPVLIIDCEMDLTSVESFINAADNWEIMLYADNFSASTNDSVLIVMDYLNSIEREHTGVFLIRNSSMNTVTLQLIKDDGFIGYTTYHESAPQSGQTSDGYVYFDYVRIASDDSFDSMSNYLSWLYANKTSMLLAFDMESINSGNAAEESVINLIDIAKSYIEYDDCSFSTVAEVVAELQQINQTEEDLKTSNEERIEEIRERIDELEIIIQEIYSKIEY
ncbi:MAG: hypothetical protein LUG49_02625 [Oscillospiraceae bacterium]|nr:hypothetical protein [Oscillospiraceae bacterium]